MIKFLTGAAVASVFLAAPALAISGLTPPFSVAANGYGSDFVANVAGSFAGSAVPEPAARALLIAGFGLTGAAMRRRQARTVTVFN
jgi:hypothetical protein